MAEMTTDTAEKLVERYLSSGLDLDNWWTVEMDEPPPGISLSLIVKLEQAGLRKLAEQLAAKIPDDPRRGEEVEVSLKFDLTKMPKDAMDKLHQITQLFRELGIGFDTGTNGTVLDWEWDWSLKGPAAVKMVRFTADDPDNRYDKYGEEKSKAIFKECAIGKAAPQSTSICPSTSSISRTLTEGRSTIYVDLSKYEQDLRKYLQDLDRSSKESKQSNIGAVASLNFDAIRAAFKSVGMGALGKQIVTAYQKKDESAFNKAYVAFLRSNMMDKEGGVEAYDTVRNPLHIMQDHLDSLEARPPWDVEGAFKELRALTHDHQEKNKGIIAKAIRRVPDEDWGGTEIVIKPMYSLNHSESMDAQSSTVEFGRDRYAPSFTLFLDGTIDDVLDAGDRDFFPQNNPQLEADYFNVVREIRKPGSTAKKGKLLTLYTARPLKDRHLYQRAKAIPTNIFLTSSEDEAYGYALEYPPRDVWMVKVYEKYLTQTLSGRVQNYQTFSAQGVVPVSKVELVDTVER
jgi:hypothetical protein